MTTSGRASKDRPDLGRLPTGVPMDVDDLDIARLETSRAIVILSP